MPDYADEARPTRLKSLVLQNFRKFQRASFSFQDQVNIFWGNNAQGKTTILEAIHLIALGRSFRTSKLGELIRHGEDSFFVEAVFETRGIEQKVSIGSNGKEKRIFLNGTHARTLSSLIGILPIVIMTPDDDLLRGPPQSRRKFLDAQISQFDPLYLHHLARYYRAMRQRNILLKTGQTSLLDPWEMEMATSGEYLGTKREEWTKELASLANLLYHKLSGTSDPFSLARDEKPAKKEEFLQRYKKDREKEMRLGATLFGPHREDLEILIQGQPARFFASEGQKRSAIAALRFASWELLKKHTSLLPMMLIDDFGLSLDRERRAHFENALPEMGQVFVTTVEKIGLATSSSTQLKA